MNIGKALCACGLHDWSCVEPGTVHIKNDQVAVLGVLWAQIGTRTCMRPGCTATQQVVREGERGVDDLNIIAGGCHRLSQRDTKTGWGWSHLDPKQVAKLEPYKDPMALELLGVRVDA